VLWGLVVVSLLVPLAGLGGPSIEIRPGSGSGAVARVAGGSRIMVLAGVLIGVLLMRLVVVFSAQF